MKKELDRADGTLLSSNSNHATQVRIDYGLQPCGLDLRLEYTIYGDLDELIVPIGGPKPQRKHELWQTTCFECFLASEDVPGYWELNLSPTGDWNVYRFAAYRQEMAEENSIMQLDSVCQVKGNAMTLGLIIPLSTLVPKQNRLLLGLCAVLHYKGGSKDYLALSHPAAKPDFHKRAGWKISVLS